jgi:hypothetical protein
MAYKIKKHPHYGNMLDHYDTFKVVWRGKIFNRVHQATVNSPRKWKLLVWYVKLIGSKEILSSWRASDKKLEELREQGILKRV